MCGNVGELYMTIEEFGQALFELLRSVIGGIGSIFRFIGDLMINNASLSPQSPLPSNSLKLFSNIAANRVVFFAIAAYILFINIFTFVSFASDKIKAKRKEIRTNENKLLMLCIIGGAAGGLLGMKKCHHKTLKKKFSMVVPALMIIQLSLYCFALGFLGFWAFF